MSKSLPPLTWFRAFEAASRHLNFTAAADEIGLTQSAVSQHVRSLEVRLGVPLFVRKPRGLALTDEGRKLQPQVGAALEMLGAATEEFHQTDDENFLTIATSVSVAQWLIAPNLAEFKSENPKARIRILGTIWPDDFKVSIADLEIRFGSDIQVGQNAVRLLPDELVPVSRQDLAHDWQNQTKIETVGTSDGWASWNKTSNAGFDPSPSLFVDSHGLALEMAVRGNGVALTSSLLAGRAIKNGDVVAVDNHRISSSEGYFLAVNSPSSLAQRFRDFIVDLTNRD